MASSKRLINILFFKETLTYKLISSTSFFRVAATLLITTRKNVILKWDLVNPKAYQRSWRKEPMIIESQQLKITPFVVTMQMRGEESAPDFSVLGGENNKWKISIKHFLLVSRDKLFLSKQVKSIALELSEIFSIIYNSSVLALILP